MYNINTNTGIDIFKYKLNNTVYLQQFRLHK